MKRSRILILLTFSIVLQSCIMLKSEHEFRVSELRTKYDTRDSIFQDSVTRVADNLFVFQESFSVKYDSLLASKMQIDSVLALYIDSLSTMDSARVLQLDSVGILRLQVSDLKRANYKLNRELTSAKKANETAKPKPGEKTKVSSFKIINHNNEYHVFIEADAGNIAMDWKGKNGNKLRSIDRLLQEHDPKIKFVTNGGMYLQDGSPQGLYIENGKELASIDTKSNEHGNFYLTPNGVFGLTTDGAFILDTKTFMKSKLKNIKYATQSGPMLVIDGETHPAFRKGSKNLHVRSGVGLMEDGSLVFAISNHPVNFYDFASLFKEKYGCENALYLDGAICKSYMPEIDRMDSGGNFGVMIYVLD